MMVGEKLPMKGRLCIAQVIPSFNVGGGELLAVRISAELMRQHTDSRLYLLSLYDPAPTIVYEEAVASGAEIISFGKKPGVDPLLPMRVMNTLRKINPDVIHTHLAGLRYSLLASFLRKPAKFHTIHNMARNEASKGLRGIYGLAFRRLGWTPIALSETVRQSVHAEYGVDPPVVFNGISIDKTVFSDSKDTLRGRCNFPHGRFVIITIGRLWVQKNHSLLIDAFNLISKKIKNCSLFIVGEDPTGGSFKRSLARQIEELPRETREHVHLLGGRKDIPQILRAADVFVLSSDWEGVPLTLLEAMGYGLPIVTTAVGGIPDIVSDGETGLLVPKGDRNGLAKGLSKIIESPAMASEMGRKASEEFELRYTIQATVRAYWDLYQSKVGL